MARSWLDFIPSEKTALKKQDVLLPARQMFAILWQHARPYKWPLLLVGVLEVAGGVLMMLAPYALKMLMDVLGHLDVTTFVWSAVLMPMLFFLSLRFLVEFCSIGSSVVRRHVMVKIRTSLRAALYRHVQNHSFDFFQNTLAGKLGARISQGSLSSMRVLRILLIRFLPVGAALLTSLVVLATVHVWLAAYFTFWMSVYIALIYMLVKRARISSQWVASVVSVSNGFVIDSVTNFANVKLFANLPEEEDRLNKRAALEETSVYYHWRYMDFIRVVQASLALVFLAGVVLFVLWGWKQGVVSIGDVALLVSLCYWVLEYLWSLSAQFMEFFEEWGSFSEGMALFAEPHQIVDKPHAGEIKVKNGEIIFDDVSFSYGNQTVFQRLNVHIRAGEKVGLVGYSGAGKTTFVSLILRMFDPTSGSIKIDNQNIADVSQSSLRQNIAVIPQDPVLFHRSLLENIRYSNINATLDEVEAAAKKAYAYDFIMHTKDGFDTLVGERGVKLSGGQRQRIAIARAFLKQASILVMDEATSALDSETEQYIQSSLRTLMEGKTVVVVAHRLSTIAHLDRILFFENGAIVEQGSHQQLLAQKGRYAHMWARQVDGFLQDDAKAQ